MPRMLPGLSGYGSATDGANAGIESHVAGDIDLCQITGCQYGLRSAMKDWRGDCDTTCGSRRRFQILMTEGLRNSSRKRSGAENRSSRSTQRLGSKRAKPRLPFDVGLLLDIVNTATVTSITRSREWKSRWLRDNLQVVDDASDLGHAGSNSFGPAFCFGRVHLSRERHNAISRVDRNVRDRGKTYVGRKFRFHLSGDLQIVGLAFRRFVRPATGKKRYEQKYQQKLYSALAAPVSRSP